MPELHDHPFLFDVFGDVGAFHEAFVGFDGHKVGPLFHQFNARHTWHLPGDPYIELAGIVEALLHAFDIAVDLIFTFEPS